MTALPHDHGEAQTLAQLQTCLDRVEDFQTVADIFKQMCDTTRIRIFWLLCHCEECVINISAMMEMSSPAVSHHLRELKTSGLIVSRRSGREVYYRAADTAVAQLLHHMIEDVMAITCPEQAAGEPAAVQSEQTAVIRQIHDQLLCSLDTRVTIEELARQHHINPTTLKTVFKEVYGESLAAHMKTHRMEEAARLLRETRDSISEIARAVGYENQSKFTAAFKETFHMLPTEYRRQARCGT